jgi:uncharacterized protein YlxW (UPF0749 family)
MGLWTMIAIIVVASITADVITKNKKTEVKRIEAEIKLEQLKLKNYEKETEKLQLELEHSKQQLIEYKHREQ